jgi:hypothetical protein
MVGVWFRQKSVYSMVAQEGLCDEIQFTFTRRQFISTLPRATAATACPRMTSLSGSRLQIQLGKMN